MSAVLGWLEGTGLATWTRESPSLWAYPTILTLHTIGLAIVVGASAVVDLRVLGVGRSIPLAPLGTLFRFIWFGFAVNAASGVLLFMADATTKAQQPVFYVKLACIAAALVATVLTRPLLTDETTGRRAAVLGALSLLFWAAAIVAGRLMAYL